LSYANSFAGEANRTVELEGEAFFDVAEDKTRPFIVKTGDLQIRVLGTAFNVKAFKGDKLSETTLLRGKVEVGVNNTDDRTILKPEQQAVYARDLKKISVSTVQSEKIALWKEGALVFDNTPFSEMEIALERWYGVEIILTDESGSNCRFSSQFQNEPIIKVLELLKATSGIEYLINGNTITINGSLCQELTNSQ
jgi:transmembrane sensor